MTSSTESSSPSPSSSSSSSSSSIPRTLLSGALVGTLFGVALEKSKVFHPAVIRSQMTLGSFVMMKTFLSATATGLVVIAVLERLGYATRVNRSISLSSNDRYGGNVVGGLVLGVGLSLAGACPGTVYAQVGSGLPSALITLAGAFAGGLAFAEFHAIGTKSSPDLLKISRSPSLDQLLKADYLKTALLFSAAFSLIVFGLEQVFPWKAELVGLFGSSIGSLSSSSFIPSLAAKAWAPEIAGMVIGLLQIPSYLLAEVPLGTSASYITVMHLFAKFFKPSLSDRHPVVQSHNTVKDLYQVGLVTGIIMGARLSQVASGVALEVLANSPQSLLVISPVTSFLGGLMLVLGARIAGGCTSGHGISGIARLSVSSFLTTAAMFAGAIGFGMLFLK